MVFIDMYTAICLSDHTITSSNFSSIKKAESYIKTHCCKTCLEDLEKGFLSDGYDDECTLTISNILDTACGAEWEIITDEEYIKEIEEYGK